LTGNGVPGQCPWDPSKVTCWIDGARAGLALQQERELMKMTLGLSKLRLLEADAVTKDHGGESGLVDTDAAEMMMARRRATFAALCSEGAG
jgi:hypothetical protein